MRIMSEVATIAVSERANAALVLGDESPKDCSSNALALRDSTNPVIEQG